MKARDRVMASMGLMVAAPQLIPSLDHADLNQVLEACLSNVSTATAVGRYSGAELLHFKEGSGGVYFLYDSKSKEVLYFVRYRSVTMSAFRSPDGHNSTRQVLLYRNSNMAASAGVASHVFWNLLLPKFDALASDSQQTPDGKKFWVYAIKEAFKRGCGVHMVNTVDRSRVDMTSEEEFLALEDKLWGPKAWFQRIILVISKE